MQGPGGGFTATWPNNVNWVGDTAPTLSTAATAVDIVAVYYNGTAYYAGYGLNYGPTGGLGPNPGATGPTGPTGAAGAGGPTGPGAITSFYGELYTVTADSQSVTPGGGSGASSVQVPLVHSTSLKNTTTSSNNLVMGLSGAVVITGTLSASTGIGTAVGYVSIFQNGTQVVGSLAGNTDSVTTDPTEFTTNIILSVNNGDTIGLYFDDSANDLWSVVNATLTVANLGGVQGATGAASTVTGPTGPTGPSSGAFLKTSVLTAASGTFTTQPRARVLYIRGLGGGGQGAGVTGAAGAVIGVGGGGGAGGYLEKTITAGVTGNQGISFVCGIGGVTGTIGQGRVGGVSTFGPVGGVTYTCFGGAGAPGATASAAPNLGVSSAASLTPLNGDIDATGAPGDTGFAASGSSFQSGGGGEAQFSGGGAGLNVTGAGNPAGGLGGGGGGAAANTIANSKPGGSGAPGCWVVIEYT